MAEKTIITHQGYQNLKKKLKHLKEVEKKEVTEKIKENRDYGEIGDNPEYDDAKKEQAFIEGKIKEIENILDKAEVIKPKEVSEMKVGVGNTVKIKDLEKDEIFTYKIVGSAETNPSENKISNKSPIGNALSGQKAGDKIEVEVPSGRENYEILLIKTIED